MEFPSDPLNGKLLEKEKRSGEEEDEEKLSDEMDSSDATSGGVGLTAVDERVPADPHRQCPLEDSDVSSLVHKRSTQ
jgi:hypothetical protein